MSKVVVTGAAGLLGRYVTKRLLARGDSVVAIDALSRYAMMGVAQEQTWPAELRHERCLRVLDRFDSSDTFALIREEAPDAIVHAAAQVSHPRSIIEPWADFETNAVGTLRLLEFLRKWDAGRPRLCYVGSAKVYDMTLGAMRETTTRIEPEDVDAETVNETRRVGDQVCITPFGVSKLAADLYCQNFSKLYLMDIGIARPGCFSGPSSLACELQNWAPPLVRAMLRGETYNVFGFRGKQVRDLLHVDDLARGIIAMLDRPTPWRGDVLNFCGGRGRDISILESVDLIERLSGKRGELAFLTGREADWIWFCGDNSKAEVVLGWHPLVDLETIFRELIEEAAGAS